MEIAEEIKLTAEFVGMKELAVDWWVDAQTEQTLILGEYRPHEDWNELMAVMEKISNTVIKGQSPSNSDQFVRVEIVPGGYVKISELRDTPIFTYVSIEGSLIAATFKAAVQFIQWHNSLTTKDK